MAKTVLVIEDNQDNREIILEFLSAYGFQVEYAIDGVEGVEKFNSVHSDLVLCDVLLPKVNGFSVCKEIKESKNPVPVILMSALYKTHALQAEAKQKYGADEYLLKPLNLVKLAQKICEFLKVSKESLEAEKEEECKLEIRGIPDKGTFDGFLPPLIFRDIYQKERTGILTCDGRQKKTTYIQEGVPIYVTSDDPEETYMALLVKDGKITSDQRLELEETSKTEKQPLGKLLISKKHITNKELADYMLAEVHERLIDLITWSEGSYQFAQTDSFLKKIKRPKMDLWKSIYLGIKRADVIDFVMTYYRDMFDNPIQKEEDKLNRVAEIGMEAEDLEEFMLIDGEKNLKDILATSPRPNDELLKVIFALDMVEVLRF